MGNFFYDAKIKIINKLCTNYIDCKTTNEQAFPLQKKNLTIINSILFGMIESPDLKGR